MVVPREINRRKMPIDAEAEAQREVMLARGEAEAILAIRQVEAEDLQKMLDAKAEVYKRLYESCGNNVKDGSPLLLIEKLEEIVKLRTEAIKNIKIDKITFGIVAQAKAKTAAPHRTF